MVKAADDPAVVICTHVVAPHPVLRGQIYDHVSTCTLKKRALHYKLITGMNVGL